MPALKKIMLGLYVAGVCGVLVQLFLAIKHCYYPGPFRDMWYALDFLRDFIEGRASLSDIFSLHGGAHRLAWPKILFTIDYKFFAGNNCFLIGSSVFALLMALQAINTMIKKYAAVNRLEYWFVFFAAVFFLFNGTQLENFVYTFDTQWFWTSSMAVCCLVSCVRALDETDFVVACRLYLLSLICFLIAVFSSFSGVCLIPVILLLCYLRGVRPKYLISISAAALIFVMAYLHGVNSGEGVTVVGPITHIDVARALLGWCVGLVQWVGHYLGSPLTRVSAMSGALLGWVMVGWLLFEWCHTLRNRQRINSWYLFCLSLALFAVGVAAVTGLGRMIFPQTAAEDRYQSITLLFWIGMSGLLWSRVQYPALEKYKPIACCLIVLWQAGVVYPAHLRDITAQKMGFDEVKTANRALLSGVFDFDEISPLVIIGDKWKRINRPLLFNDFLQREKLGIYHVSPVGLWHDDLLPAKVDTVICDGAVAKPQKLPSGALRLNGTMRLDGVSSTAELVVIDTNDRVAGFGRSASGIEPQPSTISAHSWIAYFNPLDKMREISAIYAVTVAGKYCQFSLENLR